MCVSGFLTLSSSLLSFKMFFSERFIRTLSPSDVLSFQSCTYENIKMGTEKKADRCHTFIA